MDLFEKLSTLPLWYWTSDGIENKIYIGKALTRLYSLTGNPYFVMYFLYNCFCLLSRLICLP